MQGQLCQKDYAVRGQHWKIVAGQREIDALCVLQWVQAVPAELKMQQEFKDLLMENTEKVLLSVHQV